MPTLLSVGIVHSVGISRRDRTISIFTKKNLPAISPSFSLLLPIFGFFAPPHLDLRPLQPWTPPLFSGRHAFDPAVPCSAAAAGARSIDDDGDCPGVPPQPPLLGRGLLISASTDPSRWPLWLSTISGDALRGWLPRRATSFQKLEKIGSRTYSNVYRARDLETGWLVAMKKVRVEKVDGKAMEEAVRFMMREIALLRRLDHPNIVCLEGVATSRIPDSPSLYLIFEYLDHDLAGLVASPGVQFSEPQRRRDRINEKMRALEELIPNCNKADKASMLEEAIEYLKTLQMQIQVNECCESLGLSHCDPLAEKILLLLEHRSCP